jgi:hypothetical protein
MATPPMANAASEVTPALKVVKNERRSGEDGDGLLMCDPFWFPSGKTANMLPRAGVQAIAFFNWRETR